MVTGIGLFLFMVMLFTNRYPGTDVVELEPLPRNRPNPYRIKHAVTAGAKAKITLRVVDSKGAPVEGAFVVGGFYNHGKKGHRFEKHTDRNGCVTLEDRCVGDLNFGVSKDGYYTTGTTHWFFKTGFDCVKDGRWIPWNPTVDITLKEIRNPIPLYTRRIEKPFPKGDNVGFDCMAGDFVSPWGKGDHSDFFVKYESVRTPVPPGMKLSDFLCFTNSLLLSATEGGGFATRQKDTFSKLVADYEAPKDGYTDTITYELKRTKAKIFVDRKLDTNQYLFFRSRVGKTGEKASFGKIYEFVFNESRKETNSVTLRMIYYFNPTPNDRNLEFDGRTNLFSPHWNDYNWPKDP